MSKIKAKANKAVVAAADLGLVSWVQAISRYVESYGSYIVTHASLASKQAVAKIFRAFSKHNQRVIIAGDLKLVCCVEHHLVDGVFQEVFVFTKPHIWRL